MNKTNIEYLDLTWNPTHGCSPIGEGCKNCWARVMSKRLAGMGMTGYSKDNPFEVVYCPEKLNEPLHVRKPSRIGVSFMGDLFHKDVKKWMLDRVFDRIFYDGISHHKFLILTKRPQNMYNYFKELGLDIPENVWLGVSVENQKTADERIPILLQIPAVVRFVSIEPMLAKVDLTSIGSDSHSFQRTNALRETIAMFIQPAWTTQKIDWVICGCESGQNRRQTKTEWIRDLKNQCLNAGVPFFLKQMDVGCEIAKMPILDGRVWDEYPGK